MSGEKKNTLKNLFKKPLIILILLIVAALICWFSFGQSIFNNTAGKNIGFEELSKDRIPKAIEMEVVPEYRELERALGCLVDGKVYVIVTRGEKPTSGYGVTIKEMKLEKDKGSSNLKVMAHFMEPEKGKTLSQVVTYPYKVASTELTVLPDTIELIVEY